MLCVNIHPLHCYSELRGCIRGKMISYCGCGLCGELNTQVEVHFVQRIPFSFHSKMWGLLSIRRVELYVCFAEWFVFSFQSVPASIFCNTEIIYPWCEVQSNHSFNLQVNYDAIIVLLHRHKQQYRNKFLWFILCETMLYNKQIFSPICKNGTLLTSVCY